MRQVVSAAWGAVADRMATKTQGTRWRTIYGPISGLMATLADLSWTLRGPTDWGPPSGEVRYEFDEAEHSSAPVQVNALLGSLKASVLAPLWEHAAQSRCGGGLEAGLFPDQIRSKWRQLIRQGKAR